MNEGQPEAITVTEALAVDRRRDLLRYLHEVSMAIPVTDLAHELAKYRRSEHGEPSPLQVVIPGSHIRHVYLLMFSSAGLVAYDSERDTVELMNHTKPRVLLLKNAPNM